METAVIYTFENAFLGAAEDVYDGDTLWLHIYKDFDFGFHLVLSGSARMKFRVARINCPELHAVGGSQARTFTLDWVSARSGNIEVQSLHADRYGDRWDAEIIDMMSDANLSDDLLTSGNAVLL